MNNKEIIFAFIILILKYKSIYFVNDLIYEW